MSNGINKDSFIQAVKNRQSATPKDLKFFESFRFLNESGQLPPDLERNRNTGRLKLSTDKDLREQYYLFHILKNIDTQWKTFSVFETVTHFYKSSETLNEILKEMI
ncbi:hypothetical protein [Oceanispirochaeta sp.]|jgi:hypothetical protein|uniref:hypothetical protein n=1 Tax=Oceanispirochaeta sp. TaxID=2035350 RepID=UPI0026137260|nr:hypothetical protein [Oceanispirochaeta sp.]MDA3958390.1 hypothetical protein [Oceanispirochaeta sp.]